MRVDGDGGIFKRVAGEWKYFQGGRCLKKFDDPWSNWIFCSPCLTYFQRWILNGEYVIISDRLADLPLLMAAFSFGRGNSCPLRLLYTALQWQNILENIWRHAVFCCLLPDRHGHPLPFLLGRSSSIYPWGRLMHSDWRKLSSGGGNLG